MKSPQQNTKGMSDASVDNEGTTTKSGGAKVWFSKREFVLKNLPYVWKTRN